jgi:cytochrome c556
MFRSIGLGLGLVVAAVSTVSFATEDPIATRKWLMRANGGAAGAASAMLKGETPFSPAVATSVLRNFTAVGYSFGDYFPEGSQTGDTKASPKIWEDMAGFQAAVAKFRTDAETALNSKPETLEAFKTAFGSAAQNCQSCHETYRLD